MSWHLHVPPRLVIAASVAALVAVAPVWSSSSSASAPTIQTHAQPTKSGPLSGKWSGSYKGSFSGTFTLTWQQSGEKLSGTIKISGFSDAATNIKGTIRGSSINFGTVGSQQITYSGSVTRDVTMSGTWKMQAEGKSLGDGTWKASKSS